jgi:hypothetical protein
VMRHRACIEDGGAVEWVGLVVGLSEQSLIRSLPLGTICRHSFTCIPSTFAVVNVHMHFFL